MLFTGHDGSEVWTTTGFSDWGNGLRDIRRHELSAEHRQAEIGQIQWKRGARIDKMMDKNRSLVVEDNRRVVECAIDCVRFLATEMIAFWGSTSAHGKFISLFRCLAKRDHSAAAYLEKVDAARRHKRKMATNLISHRNITNLLLAIKQMIIDKTVLSIAKQKKVCIVFDSTQDTSKREASVLLVRYLQNENIANPHVVERILELFTTGESSGTVLKEHVIRSLEKAGISIDWIVGQCYDGAGNMRGAYSGMATLIQNENRKAVYIWCYAHRLNLVMNAVASCCTDVRNTLGILEELYSFMNGHKRNDVFVQAQGGSRTMQLKRVSTTRWNSTEAAVDTVFRKFDAILEALEQLSHCTSDRQ